MEPIKTTIALLSIPATAESAGPGSVCGLPIWMRRSLSLVPSPPARLHVLLFSYHRVPRFVIQGLSRWLILPATNQVIRLPVAFSGSSYLGGWRRRDGLFRLATKEQDGENYLGRYISQHSWAVHHDIPKPDCSPCHVKRTLYWQYMGILSMLHTSTHGCRRAASQDRA